MPLEALRHDVTPIGMHYLLIHYDVPLVEDIGAWRLEIGGAVAEPLSLSLDDLRMRETVSATVTMECAGNGRALLDPRPVSQPWILEAVGTAEWTGTPLAPLLAEAGLEDGVVEVVFTGADRGVEDDVEQDYARALAVADATAPEVMVVWGMNGQLLPPQHGAPLRLLVPGWYGMTSVKWLRSITALTEPFDGYQNTTAYRWRETEDDPGIPLSRIEPRSLIAPPGVPDFATRQRFVDAGPVSLTGRAWSGYGPVAGVEVSVDGGREWAPAALQDALGAHAWSRWSFEWTAAVGEHEICCRCWDESGRRQPDEIRWNTGGYAVNAPHRIPVTAR